MRRRRAGARDDVRGRVSLVEGRRLRDLRSAVNQLSHDRSARWTPTLSVPQTSSAGTHDW
ncbi:MAG: hypothetical protein ACK56F_03835 [bacterium]